MPFVGSFPNSQLYYLLLKTIRNYYKETIGKIEQSKSHAEVHISIFLKNNEINRTQNGENYLRNERDAKDRFLSQMISPSMTKPVGLRVLEGGNPEG